jgi:hypothetical protein
MTHALKPVLWLAMAFAAIAVVGIAAMYVTGDGPIAFDF